MTKGRHTKGTSTARPRRVSRSGWPIWSFCPRDRVTPWSDGGFLHRVVVPIAPFSSPVGPATFDVGTSGTDGDNDCLAQTSPCETIEHALTFAVDGDTITIGTGTFVEQDLRVGCTVTISGDPAGGTTIEALAGFGPIFEIERSSEAARVSW